MPLMEAMACGLPSIATDWGAHTEFVHDGIAYPLRIRGLVPADARAPYYKGFRWADPDPEHLAHLFRHVVEHREEAAGRAAAPRPRWPRGGRGTTRRAASRSGWTGSARECLPVLRGHPRSRDGRRRVHREQSRDRARRARRDGPVVDAMIPGYGGNLFNLEPVRAASPSTSRTSATRRR